MRLDFWQPFRYHTSGQAAYRRLSRFAPGRSITSGRLAGGPPQLAGDARLETFRRTRFSREVAWLGSCHGPRSIRCEGLPIAAASPRSTSRPRRSAP